MPITKASVIKQLNKLNIPVTPDGYVKTKHVKWALSRIVKSDLVTQDDLARSENLTPTTKRDLLEKVYETILTGLGREEQMPTLKRAIKMIPDREVEAEWEAVMDGTVSKMVKTMMNMDKLSPEELEEWGAIWEGLAKPYFRDYKGDVPKEDLKWAHNMIKDYFDRVADKPEIKKLATEERKRIG